MVVTNIIYIMPYVTLCHRESNFVLLFVHATENDITYSESYTVWIFACLYIKFNCKSVWHNSRYVTIANYNSDFKLMYTNFMLHAI